MTSADKPNPASAEYQKQRLALLERVIVRGRIFHNIESGNGTSDKPLLNKISYGREEMMEVVLFVAEETENQMEVYFDSNGTILKYSPKTKTFTIHKSYNKPEYEAELLEDFANILESMENNKNQVKENLGSVIRSEVVRRASSVFSAIKKLWIGEPSKTNAFTEYAKGRANQASYESVRNETTAAKKQLTLIFNESSDELPEDKLRNVNYLRQKMVGAYKLYNIGIPNSLSLFSETVWKHMKLAADKNYDPKQAALEIRDTYLDLTDI